MVFVPDEQQKQAINIANDVLRDYKHCLHRARQRPDIGSPKLTGMPSGGGSSHPDDQIVDWIDDPNRAYCDYCRQIVRAIEIEESAMFGDMLKMLYFGWHTSQDVKDKYLLGYHPYYDAMKRAKLCFGESVNVSYIRKLRMGMHKLKE